MRFLAEYTGKTVCCSCGKSHTVRTMDVRLGENAIRELPEVLKNCCPDAKGLAVCDTNTWTAAGENAVSILHRNGFECQTLLLPGEHVHANAEHLARIRNAVADSGCRWLLAVGSGSINDMVKVAASSAGIPYVILGTAASMDGFLSANAAIFEDGIKKQYLNLAPPAGAVADSEILRNAPSELTLSGLGDALGKFTSLAEWKLNHLVLGEFYCPTTADLVRREVMNLLTVSEEHPQESDAFFNALIGTLLITGVAMQMLGNSTPASGGEHYISHVLDMYGVATSGESPSTHGLQVALGTWKLLNDYKTFHERNKSVFELKPEECERHIQDWANIGIDLSETIRSKQLLLKQHFSSLTEADSTAMKEETAFLVSLFPRIERLYLKSGLPMKPEQLAISESLFRFACDHAVDMRKRLTLFDLNYF